MVQQPSYWKVLTRRKPLNQEGADGESKLNRVLGLYDLTALGVGSTLGAGVYVLAGQIAKDQAGPSVMLSFAIAALASLLAGVCYAEFGARVPKAGSAYVYSYVCIGEFAAFVIGWNLILEYMIGTASVCRGISLYLDTMINDTLKTTFAEIAPMNVSFLGSYFDFFAFGLVVVFGIALAFGVETSTMANNFCTCLNLFILLFVIVAGSIKANFQNWTIDINTVNSTIVPPHTDLGAGGFFPFGFSGTLKGAATCFFGFVGFDCIATTGEEVKNPRKNIPKSILLSLLVIFLCYFGVSTVLTLMVPYYLQDANAPLPSAFKEVGWMFAMWIVSIGGLVGLLASLFGALFPLPRVMYSMAQDGLMFRFLGKIHPKYRVPVVGSIFAAVITALIAGLFDLAQLVNLLSIGTLLAYSVVAISITLLRYMDNSESFATVNGGYREIGGENGSSNGHLSASYQNGHNGHGPSNGHSAATNGHSNGNHISESSLLTSAGERVTFKTVLTQLFNFKRIDTPNALSTRIVGSLITLFCLLSMGIGLIFMQAYDALITNQLWVLIILCILCFITALVLLCICLQPREIFSKVFRVPFVPIVPAISIFINIYLMLQLDVMTWIRFAVWMAIGIPWFIACWRMHDIKNPEKRNPERIEFERLLRQGDANPPYHNEENGGIKTLGGGISQTSTLIMQQNERSVRSLDEIIDIKDCEQDLLEVKRSNGQILYVEDSTGDKLNDATNSEFRNELAVVKNSDEADEEKSVIAMLDDVLQDEDEADPQTPAAYYDRQFSIDSEMLPSVIHSTTKATVHSSSSSSNSENSINLIGQPMANGNSPDSGFVELRAVQQQANSLVDDILNNPRLLQALEKSQSYSRHKSIESLQSLQSVEDPLHSEKFRNKLSQLIIKPPEPKLPKEQQAEKPDSNRKLRHSKSEADIRLMVLKAIEGCADERDEENESTQAKDQVKIPKAPKFDPVLYKTVNTLGQKQKERPKLEVALKPIAPLAPVQIEIEAAQEDESSALPFKRKLEAILQRGPSHRTQTRPDVQLRRPKSMDPLTLQAKQEAHLQSEDQQLRSQSVKNLQPTMPANAIEEIRRTLKPVKSKPSTDL